MSTIDYGTVRGRYLATTRDSTNPDTPDLTPMSGTVTLTAQVDALLTEDATLLPVPVVCTLDAEGDLSFIDSNGISSKSVRVVATDSLTNPTDFTYRVSHNLTHEKRHVPYASFNIQVPSGSVVDLETVAPVPTSTGEAVVRGQSAYELALLEGYAGSREEWLASLEGTSITISGTVPTSADLPVSDSLINGQGWITDDDTHLHVWDGEKFIDVGPVRGPAGPSAYEEAVSLGFTGTEVEWLNTLIGPRGPAGTQIDVEPSAPVSTGIEGDLYLDSVTGVLYRWAN